MDAPTRVSASQVTQEMESGGGLLLVCAYDDEAKCNQLRILGSLTLHELEGRLPSLPMEQEIVFYCG